MVGRAHRSALAAVLLHIDAAVCRHSSLRAVGLEVWAALLAGVAW